MLVVVTANLTASEVFKQKALFPRLLQLRGLTVDTSPVEQMLRQHSVLTIAEKNIKPVSKFSTLKQLEDALSTNPLWLVIHDDEKGIIASIAASDVVSLLLDEKQLPNWLEAKEAEPVINLMSIPGRRLMCKSIFMQSNLQEALDSMATRQVECLSIHYGKLGAPSTVMGIIQQEKIHNHYRYTL